MIGRLRGVVLERTAGSAVVDVHGVGYLVTVTGRASLPLGAEVDLHVHTHVRDDAIQLFGFADAVEREVFQLLIGVPTIGPVKAMGILETPAPELAELVRRKDTVHLSKLPGVGKRTAERLVLDLADKIASLGPLAAPGSSSAPDPQPGVARDLVSALQNLGYKPASAEALADKALETLGRGAALEALIREAVGLAGRR